MNDENTNNTKKIQSPRKSEPERLEEEYSVDRERTKLAGRVTHLLIFVFVFNTMFTTIITFLLGFKTIDLSLETYVSYVVSSISIIGITSLIVRLLPNNTSRSN